MSARAAARLESLGFGRVYRYKAGKEDWLANGWPAEGSDASLPQAKDFAHKDVPTCRPQDKIEEVRRSMQAAGGNTCVVVDHQRVVLGLIHGQAQAGDPQATAESLMECGPKTYRMDASIDKMAEFMQRHSIDRVLVTDTDGRLVGIVLQKDIGGLS